MVGESMTVSTFTGTTTLATVATATATTLVAWCCWRLVGWWLYGKTSATQQQQQQQQRRRSPPAKPGSLGRALCLINPHGGGGRGANLFESIVRDILVARGFDVERRDTERPKHAIEMTRALVSNPTERQKYAILCIVGGDGLVNEAINGLFGGEAPTEAITASVTPGTAAWDPLPVLVIPAGTGNGVFTSLRPDLRRDARAAKCEEAAWCSQVTPVDLFRVIAKPFAGRDGTTLSGTAHTSLGILSVSYGTIADGDYLAENKYRCYGPDVANIISAVNVLYHNKRYRARVTYWDEDQGGREVTEDGEYSSVICLSAPYLTHDMLVSPRSQLDDGLINLYLIKPMSRMSAISYFLDMGSGAHVNNHQTTRVIRTKRVRLEPVKSRWPTGDGFGVIMCDGEMLPLGLVEMEALPHMARFYA